jgi:putative hemolysin
MLTVGMQPHEVMLAVGGIVLCVVLGAFLSALEATLAVFGEARLVAVRDEGGATAKWAARILDNSSVLQTRISLARVILSSFGIGLTVYLATHVWHLVGVAGAVVLLVAVRALLTEVLSTLGRMHANRLAIPLVRGMWPVLMLFAPLAMPYVAVGGVVSRLWPARPEDDPERVTELDVEHMIEQGEQQGSIPEEHAELLRSVLEFKDTIAREVMVPRTRMVAIEKSTSIEQVFALIVDKGHSRYPVYKDTADQVEGVLYAKDLFRLVHRKGMAHAHLHEVVRKPPFFVAETQKIGGLLREMQSRRVHLAVVVDEFGGTSGIVTLEDILEEIVGEIRDEHDTEELGVQRLDEHRYLADARISVYDLAEFMGGGLVDDLPKANGNYESLGGMLIAVSGGVPHVGEKLRVGEYLFTVMDADERHVRQVEIERVQKTPSATPPARESGEHLAETL